MRKRSFFTGLCSGIESPVTARPSGRTRALALQFGFMRLEPRRRDRIREGLVEELFLNARVGLPCDRVELEALAIGWCPIDEDQDRVPLV